MNFKVENIYGKIRNKNVTAKVPGSKSLTARALVCAALASGKSTLYGISLSDDSLTLVSCLQELGIGIKISGGTATVEGCGGKIPSKNAKLYVGSSGTAARFITALAAFSEGEYFIDASEQMKRRPIKPLLESLKSAGACIEGENFPLKIKGAPPRVLRISADISESSQYLSALMLSSVTAENPMEIAFSGKHFQGYADMTAGVMRSFGAYAEKKGNSYVTGGGLSACVYKIEPDVSAACYFYAANRILDTDIRVEGIPRNSLQGDLKFIEFIKDFNGGKVNASAFSDQTLTLAAVAPYLEKPTEIFGVPHVRKQECDRLNAIQVNLFNMGVRCEEFPDGVKIYPSAPCPAHIKTFGDHRVAMAFALTGLRADGIEIADAEAVSKTFKDYFEVLNGVCAALTGRERP